MRRQRDAYRLGCLQAWPKCGKNRGQAPEKIEAAGQFLRLHCACYSLFLNFGLCLGQDPDRIEAREAWPDDSQEPGPQVPATQCLVLGTRYWFLVAGTWYLVPGTSQMAPGTRNLVPGAWCLAPSPGTWHQAPCTWYKGPGARCVVSGTVCLALGARYLGFCTWWQVPHAR